MIHSISDMFIPGIILFAMLQGTVLMALLLKLRKGNRLGHRLLACLIFFFTFHLASNLIDDLGFFVDAGTQLYDVILVGLALTIAPLIYLYTDVITKKNAKILSLRFWSHFLPAILYLLLAIVFLYNNKSIQLDADTQLLYLDVLTFFTLFFCLVQIFIYLVFSFLRLRQHRKTIEGFFSTTEKINLNWLRNILIGFALFYVIILSKFFFAPFEFEKQFNDILTLSMVALVYLLGYMGMQQADIFGKEVQALTQQTLIQEVPTKEALNQKAFTQEKLMQDVTDMPHVISAFQSELSLNKLKATDKNTGASQNTHKDKHQKASTQINASIDLPQTETQQKTEPKAEKEPQKTTKSITEVETEKKEKYQKSALDKETSKLLFDDLLNFMTEKKPYLENDISLSGLAEKVALSPNYLSQIINEQTESNFFDFINRYRVTYFKQLLAEQIKKNTHHNMIDTALNSGFNSKSSFYKAFKKYEDMTPSQYKKSIGKDF